MPAKITTYAQAFELLGITNNEKMQQTIERLTKEGHSEKGICFSIWRSQDKLLKFKGDQRFYSVLENEVRKYSWPKDDPRWQAYVINKAKEEILNAEIEENKKKLAEKLKIIEYQKALRKKPNGNEKGFIYFVQGENGGAIKIGYTKDVESRLKALQTGYPDTLKVICLLPGNEKKEKALHYKYRNIQLRGEWFKPDNILLNDIAKWTKEVSHFEL
ncbi:MAG TPA: GIY-YIG nuclease family protein [Patescibacteria group bacterium]|nr:GIY-YIG nuclease family protein [Patescibacteria group bacterium]